MLASLYFRAEVRGLERIPEEGPVLLVGNHSGGNLTPDTCVFTLAFSTYFGVERRFYQLAHNLVLVDARPRLAAQVRHGRRHARRTPSKALDSGAALLVYPGGDYEVHRPDLGVRARSTSAAARASSGWRSSRTCRSSRWSRSAARRRRSSSPAASAWPGCCGLDRMFRLKVLPISLALPVGAERRRHARPLAAAGEDHDPGARADRPARGVRSDPDLDEVYDEVLGRMQATLTALQAERRLPVLG